MELNEAGSFGLVLNIRAETDAQWEIFYAGEETKFDTENPRRSGVDAESFFPLSFGCGVNKLLKRFDRVVDFQEFRRRDAA